MFNLPGDDDYFERKGTRQKPYDTKAQKYTNEQLYGRFDWTPRPPSRRQIEEFNRAQEAVARWESGGDGFGGYKSAGEELLEASRWRVGR